MTSAVEELEAAAELCAGMRPSPDDATLTSAVLEPVSAFLDAEMGVFRVFTVDDGEVRLTRVTSFGVPRRIDEAYLAVYSRLDPARYMSRHRFATPLFSTGLDSGEWQPHPPAAGSAGLTPTGGYLQDFLRYRSEFLLPNRLEHHLGFCFQEPAARSTFLFDFHRRSAPFERLELARAKVVAMLLHARFAEARDTGGGPAAVPCDVEGRLSSREREVARAVTCGLSNKEIAARMSISVRTVENHLRSIFAKIGVSTRTRLAAKLRDARLH